MDEPLEKVQEQLRGAQRIAVLTGAGISAESGIPTFRGSGGLWRKHRPEELASPEAFARDPRLVWEWYLMRRRKIAEAQPNESHKALAQLERNCSDFWLITQNVDGLHREAGSRKLLEIHGDIWRTRCTGCGRFERDRRIVLDSLPPLCVNCACPLRPDIVWFGESLPESAIAKAFEAAANAQIFLVVGTAGLVQPAASLASVAKENRAFVVEINPEETPLSTSADVCLRSKSGKVLQSLVFS